MAIPLRILIVEDNPDDAELMMLHLKEAGFQPDWQRVETEADYLAALASSPGLILSDWSLPHFNGLRALQLLNERGLNLPFIIVSGSIGEETAIDALRHGADDYVLKDRPARLGQSARRALEDKKIREERRQAEEALRESEAHFRIALENSPIVVFNQDRELRYTWIYNPHPGFDPQTMLGKTDAELFPTDDTASLTEIKRRVLETGVTAREEVRTTIGGQAFFYDITVEPLHDASGNILGVTCASMDVTERKRAEESLRLQSSALNAAANAIVITDNKGVIEWVNPAFTALTGYAAEEAIGKNPRELVKSGKHERAFYKQMWDTILAGKIWQSELVNRRKDDSLYSEEQTITPVQNTDGSISHFIAIKQDITERKRAELELHHRTEDLELINTLNGLVNRGDSLERIIDTLSREAQRVYSAHSCTLFLLSPDRKRLQIPRLTISPPIIHKLEQMIGQPLPQLDIRFKEGGLIQKRLQTEQGVITSDPKLIQQWILEFADSISIPPALHSLIGKLVPQIFKFLHIGSTLTVPLISNNETFGLLELASADLYTADDLSRVRMMSGQVTAAILRKRAEEKIIASEAELRALFASMQDVVLTIDKDGIYRKIAPTNPELLYKPPEELLGKSLAEVFPQAEADQFLSTIREVLETGKPKQIEYQLRIGETLYWFLTNVTPMSQELTVWVAHDITERKNAQDEIRNLKEFDENLINTMSEGIVVQNSDGNFSFVNPAVSEITGYPPEELLGGHWSKFIPADQHEIIKEIDNRRLGGEASRYEIEFLHKSGKRIHLLVSGSPLFENERFNGTMAVFTDNTERKQAEEALKASEERYRAFVQNSSEAIWRLELDPPLPATLSLNEQVDWLYEHARVVECNEAMAAMHKYGSREEMIGLRLGSLLPRLSQDNLHLVQDFIRAGYRISGRESIELSHDVEIRYFVSSLTGILEDSVLRRIWGGQRDVTEQRLAQQSLRESEDRFRDLIEHSHDLIGTHDLNGQILSVNPATTGLLGIEPQAILKMNLIDLLAPEARGQFKDYLAAIQRDGKASGIMRVQTASGEKRIWEYDNTLRAEGVSQPVVRALARDITERVKAEEQIKRRVAELEALYQSGIIFGQTLDQKDIAEKVIEVLAGRLNWHHAAVRVRREESEEVELLAFNQSDKYQNDKTRIPSSISHVGQGLAGWVIQHGKSQRVNNLDEDPRYHETFAGMKSGLYVPMSIQNKTIGCISAEGDHPNAFTDEDERFLITLARQAAIAIQNAELFQATQTELAQRKQRERELEALATVSAAMRTAPSRTEMLPVILEQLLAQLGVDGAALEILDLSSRELLIELGYGIWNSLTGVIIPPGEGVSAQVVESGQPYLNNDVREDSRLFRPDAFSECRAAAAAPLKVQGKVIGDLWIGSKRLLDDHDLNLLTSIADIAANAIHRAALHEETETRLGQLTALRTIDQTILGSLDKNFTLKTISEQGLIQLKADAVGVLLLNSLTFTLEYAEGSGFRTREIEHTHVRVGEGQAGRAALERRTLNLPELAAGEVAFTRPKLIADEGFVAYHATPMIAKGQVVGVLEVFHRTRFTPDTDWLNFLETLAGQAALTIENATLFGGLQRSNAELAVAYDATIEGWSRAMDLRDKETEGHTLRVTDLTLQLASAMKISKAEMVHIRRGALLHDMGKMGIPDQILLKPGKLTKEEWELMRKHPEFAYDMLSPIPYLRQALTIPYCHHEKWDGTGYPRGLKGDTIPLEARMFAVVDVWDALTSDRPYREAWSKESALTYIREQSGKHFDPLVVEVFLKLLDHALTE